MLLSNSLKTLAVLIAVTAPVAAFADHDDDNDRRDRDGRYDRDDRDDRRDDRDDRRDHDRRDDDRHGARWDSRGQPAPGNPRPGGHYELQTVSTFQRGYEERVWVDGVCRTFEKRHKTKTVCERGHYENRWVAGRHVQTSQWVWVADRLPTPPRERVVYRDPAPQSPTVKVVFTGRF